MISPDDAKRRRIFRLFAQILRASENVRLGALLKALFNDNALIFARKWGDSARPLRVEIG